MSDTIAAILQSIAPSLQGMIDAGDDSLQFFVDQTGKNLIEETMGKYVADFNQANKGAMDTSFRQTMARGGDVSIDATKALQYQFQTALGRAQSAQAGRRAEISRRDSLHNSIATAGQNAQGLAAQMGTAVYSANKALEGDKYVSNNSLEETKYSSDLGLLGDQARAAATTGAAQTSADASKYVSDNNLAMTNIGAETDIYGYDLEAKARQDALNAEVEYNDKQLTASSFGESNDSNMVRYYDGASGQWNFGVNNNALDVGENLETREAPETPGITWYDDDTALSNYANAQ